MTEAQPESLAAVVHTIRLLALDSDGVLTDGGVYIGDDGREFRRFDIKDGLGLKRVMEHGIIVAVLSASPVEAVRYRCTRLGITEIHLGIVDKLTHLRTLCARCAISLEQVAYIGDDLADLQVMKVVGLPCTPADAVPAVREAARIVTERNGGHGAVREICDLLTGG